MIMVMCLIWTAGKRMSVILYSSMITGILLFKKKVIKIFESPGIRVK